MMNRAGWLCLVWCLAAFGLGLLIGSATCHAQARDTPAVVPLNPSPAKPLPPKGQDCHFNASNQLVCRHCWIDLGRVRCGKPRIVKQPEQPGN